MVRAALRGAPFYTKARPAIRDGGPAPGRARITGSPVRKRPFMYEHARFLLSAASPGDFPLDEGVEIAFAGRSNSGKSSAINTITGRRGLARTSRTPGRTQLINFFELAGGQRLADLPGYGYAKVSKDARHEWGKLVEKYLAEREQLVLSILIVDARHEPSPLDLQMKSWLQHFQLPYLVVSTKVDKLSANERHKSLQTTKKVLETERIIQYSSIARDGMKEVWNVIRESVTK